MQGRVSRRAVLLGGAAGLVGLGGAGFAGVEARVLPGRGWLNAHLGLDGPNGVLPDVAPGRIISGTFLSAHRQGRTVGWAVAYPTLSMQDLPVVVVLHGHGDTHRDAFAHQLGLDRYLVAGGHQFAIASIDGGDTYWHHRVSGEDSAAMVIQEFLPILAAHRLRTDRIGLLGWSMGGFGAIWLASRLGPTRTAAIAAESPAIWHHAAQTAPGAFDDPADFTAHDVFSHTQWVHDIPLRIDCGTDDGFYPAARDYASVITPKPEGRFQPGGHNLGYWRRNAPAQLAFLAQHLI